MEIVDPSKVMRTLQGVVALCMGSSDKVVWMDQGDAAAFTDGDQLFLPRPSGKHPQEYALLLAIALREVAKLTHTPAGSLAAEVDAKPYVAAVDEARVKRAFGTVFLGAPAIFNEGLAIAWDGIRSAVESDDTLRGSLPGVAVWAAAHDAVLGTISSDHALRMAMQMSEGQVDRTALAEAVRLARGADSTGSASESVLLGRSIAAALRREPDQERAEQGGGAGGDDQGSPDHASADAPEAAPKGEVEGDREADDIDGGGQGQETGPGTPDANAPNPSDGASPDPGDGDQSDAGGSGCSGTPRTSQSSQGAKEEPEGGPGDKGDAGTEGSASSAASAGQSSETASTDRQNAGGESANCDPLSDALARANGFTKAVDVSSSADAIRGAQTETAEPVPQAQLDAIAEALADPDAAAERLLAVGTGDQDDELDLGDLETNAGGLAFASDEVQTESNRLGAIPGRLVSVFLAAMQEKCRRPFQKGSAGRKLAVGSMWRLQHLGDPRVFRRSVEACGRDAAVSLLLDASASMDQVGMEAAAVVTHAMAVALTRISGVQVSVDVFPSWGASSREVLAFKGNLKRAERELRAVVASGGTPTGAALATRLAVLERVAARRKFVFVITDGKPHPTQRQWTMDLIKKATANGVTVVGVGIKTDVSDLFPICGRVEAVGNLPTVIERLFKNELAERLAA